MAIRLQESSLQLHQPNIRMSIHILGKWIVLLLLISKWIYKLLFVIRSCKTRKNKNNPKYKSAKHSRKAYTTNNQKGTVAIIDNKYIKLPKIGKVKAVIHSIPSDDWIIKSATVSQESDGKYYISVLFRLDHAVNLYVADKTNAVGLDYASDGLYVNSNGNVGTNHKYYRESHGNLRKEQHKLSRMQGSKKHEGKSNNYKKQLCKINKIHRHIANKHLDNLHKNIY